MDSWFWILWGAITAINVIMLIGTRINLKKTSGLLEEVETHLEEDREVMRKNMSLLAEMKSLVLGK